MTPLQETETDCSLSGDNSSVDGYETTEELEDSYDDEEEETEDEENNPLTQFPLLNHYFNNLNRTFHYHLNNKINNPLSFVTENSLWKLYESSSFPTVPFTIPKRRNTIEVITNLWKQISDEESEATEKRIEFESIQKKAKEDVQRQLGPREFSNNKRISKTKERVARTIEAERILSPIVERGWPQVATPRSSDTELNEEFWGKFLGLQDVEDENAKTEVTDPVNPFYNRFYLTAYDKVKLVILLPLALLRVIGILVFLTLACIMIWIGELGISTDESQLRPLSKWRRCVRWLASHIAMRTVFFCAGFHWVNKIGKLAPAHEASVIVAAPHSSYFDAFVVTLLGGPSVVAKASAKDIPFFGRLINFTQPIYVNREDPSSRSKCANEIQRRANSEEEWPQIFIFPEGTCTNRSALAQFKLGSFNAGVPIQPVIIRYPNRVDGISWTFDGPIWWWGILVSLTQFHNSLELEFLPVYYPTEYEKEKAVDFAQNVQNTMAESLGIPATDFTFEDGNVLTRLSQSQIRKKLKYIWQKTKDDLNLRRSPIDTSLITTGVSRENFDWNFTFSQFQSICNVSDNDEKGQNELKELFSLFQKENSDTIDIRPYLMLTCFLYSNAKVDLFLTLIYKIYHGRRGGMSKENFMLCMEDLFECSEKEASQVFQGKTQIQTANRGTEFISFELFQTKLSRRMEFIKLYTMEETGQRSGNFPRRSQRDQRPMYKPKLE